jgi:autotransporter-associated beta strand protein
MRFTRKADNVRPTRRVGAMLAAAVAAFAGATNLWAGIAFDPTTSTLRITHDANINDLNDTPFIKNPSTVPPSSLIFPTNNYQMNHTFSFTSDGGVSSSTIAAGSLGHVTNATTASFILATGTGVVQDDPNDTNIKGPSSLRFDFDLRWDVTTGGFGPLANGYASLAVGGNVGVGGSATVITHLIWRNQSGTVLRTTWDNTTNYGPGTFTDILTTSRVLGSGALSADSKLRVNGFVEFQASNEGGPTTINPIRVEMGGAPPTAHFKIDQSGSYFDPANWESVPVGEDGLVPIANAAGQRAVFFGTNGKVGQTVSLGSTVTLGTLDIGGNSPYSFTNGDSGRFQFITQNGGNAVLNARGGLSHAILVPVEVPQALDLITERSASIGFGNAVNGTGNIQKFGPGSATLAASNANFAGDISVFDGTIHGNAFRALGLGHVVVDGGDLEYGAGGASANPVIVKRGLINVDGVDTNDRFQVQQGGGIGGNPAVVNTLRVGQNLALNGGAMIVHGDPQNVQNGNPQNLGIDPLYVFGIAGALPVGEMVVGTASGTPWVGIGGSRGDSSFGTSEGLVTVAGSAVLATLPGGSFDLQSHLAGSGGLTKMGDGSVRLLNTNPFSGQTSINEGALIVNGSLGGDVTVKTGGTAAGTGSLIGLLRAAEDGSAVAPGDGGVGKLSVGKLELGDQTSLDFDLDSPSNSDLIQVAGDLVLDGQLFVEAADNFGPGKYPIMTYGGNVTDNGLKVAFAPEGLQATIEIDSNEIIILGKGVQGAASGGTVYLVVVPEPATMTMLGMAGLALISRRRRR